MSYLYMGWVRSSVSVYFLVMCVSMLRGKSRPCTTVCSMGMVMLVSQAPKYATRSLNIQTDTYTKKEEAPYSSICGR